MKTQHVSHPISRLHWLPNALSTSRGVLAFPVCYAAANEYWVVGVWLMLVALLTDFLDGLAAKKLHAQSKLGGHIDRVADFLLAGMGTLGLIASGVLSAWILLFCIPAAIFVGYVKFLTRAGTKLYRVTSALSVITLFSFWTLILWCLLAKAYGWSWLYPVITLTLLCIAARLKRHRLRAWFGWIKAKAKR
ncbi:MAG TPA: CDP-alcohol phosphatidyltransferase family protein [Candidatus Saccharimonadales bacterium]|nr:CDP-alcohol phosphatidyltransferase family protein [Candidatus Saccharimonadales bacterium]